MTPDSKGSKLSRRAFLVKTGWVAAGVTVLTSCGGLLPTLPTTASPEREDGNLWIQMMADGRVRFMCPRMEMGQGAILGLSQICAAELNIDQADIECVEVDTSQLPPFKMTVGSESIAVFAKPVAFGAANLREVLRKRAAAVAVLKVAEVTDAKGGFSAAGKFIAYAELVPEKPEFLEVEFDENVPLYLTEAGRFDQKSGQSWKLHDIEDIVTGRRRYSRDIDLSGMLFGDVARPPFFGAKLLTVKVDKAKALKGVVDVVVDVDDNFAAVITENPFILMDAIEAMEVTWRKTGETLDPDQLRVSRHRLDDDFEHTLDEYGSAKEADAAAAHKLTAEYSTSFMAHAAMEPRAAVASVTPRGVDVWCGSQDPYFIRARIADLLSRSAEDVVVHPLPMGGGFGGRVLSQPAEEAAILSAHVGKPVSVRWSRESEFQHNYFQPPFSHAIDAGLDADGKIAYWRHDFVSSPIIFGLVEKPLSLVLDAFVADKGTARGALAPYAVGYRRIRYSDIRTPVPIGAWRGLGSAPNTFAIESMMDELAVAAKTDALQFRLRHLGQDQQRLGAVLQRVGEISPWGAPRRENEGTGLACSIYKGETFVAVVARVHIDHAAQKIKVVGLWCVQDCGLVINPDQVENQVLGNLMWGCGLALKEKMTFADGVADQSNFDTYEILRHDETPAVVIELSDGGAFPPTGVGESALPPVAAAIANAVHAATDVRPRHLPFNYDILVS